MSIVSELRRRQVFRTAAWYGGFAWLAVEVANTVFPQFGLPGWSVRAIIVAALLGLPVVVALAWWFDLTIAGVRREAGAVAAHESTDRAASVGAVAPAAARVWRIPSFWIALALGAGLAVSAQQAWLRLVEANYGERPALAVLPFANLSPDPENAYFADGLHEEILATLARAGGLKVISRTSVLEYRDPKRNLRDIADALDVTLIMEGSVRRAGDDLRLTLQLIDGRTDEHLWSETYDRKFRDTLQLQKTIAEQVVAAIGARLSPAEQELIEQTAPNVPEAYERYLHARALAADYFPTDATLRAIAELLDESIRLDPSFAPAYALRGRFRVWRSGDLETEAEKAAVRADIDRALELQPGLPEALVARGLYELWVTRDAERALDDLTRALALAPNDLEAHRVAGLTMRRLGRFDEALEHFRALYELAPGQLEYDWMYAGTLIELGRLDEAQRALELLIERHPTWPNFRLNVHFVRFLATGETTGYREEFDRLRPTIEERFLLFQAQRALLSTGDLRELLTVSEAVHETASFSAEMNPFEFGLLWMAAGDADRARPYLVEVASGVEQHPDDAYAQAEGAIALELLGRRADALAAADRAVKFHVHQNDAVNGPQLRMLRAWVLIRSGTRAEEGYAEFDRWLGSYSQQPRWVAVQPLWRLLADDARLQQIIQGKLPVA